MKRFLGILMIATWCLALALAAVACDNTTPSDGQDAVQALEAKTMAETCNEATMDVPTITDYTVAEGFDIGTVRFAFYSPETGWIEDVNDAPFDESKPTVIHAHGQGADGYMFTPDALYGEGYNVMSFLWGTLSDDMDVLRIETRIWQRIADYVDYENNGAIRTAEGFNCTVPELYVARYCDFFALHPDYRMPIRLTGHSYGGQLTCALATYFTKMYKENRIPARLLPERYTMLDPYFDNYGQDFECAWLGTTIHYSSVGAALYALANYLTPNNVAIEMLRTSMPVEFAGLMSIFDDDAPSYFDLLKPLFRVVELNNQNDLQNQFSNKIYGTGMLHTFANYFYFSPDAKLTYADADGVVCFGRANSASLVLATRGMRFNFYVDAEDYTRYDNITIERAQHVVSAKEDENGVLIDTSEEDAAAFEALTVVAGLVSADANGNGLFDDLAADRLNDVTVVLEDVATGEKQTVRTVGGYYRFDVQRGTTYVLTTYATNYQSQSATVTASNFVNVKDFALGK